MAMFSLSVTCGCSQQATESTPDPVVSAFNVTPQNSSAAPTKTPDPGPPIDEVLMNWKLIMPTKTFAVFQEMRTQRDANVKLNETFDAEYKGRNFKIKLIGVDTKKFTATVEMENLLGQKQTKVYSMM
ncbi:MAG TPA: hypothetical protein PKH51_08745 [Candidatus Sumerlaeota bacterium]|nr:hypothetical protein [Candidatus Sumerlaeota bacterium]